MKQCRLEAANEELGAGPARGRWHRQGRRRALAMALMAAVAGVAVSAASAVAFATGRTAAKADGAVNSGRRTLLLLGGSSMLVPATESAGAWGTALDYRKFEEINVSNAQIVGDKDSDAFKKGLAVLLDCQIKMDQCLNKFGEDSQIPFDPYFDTKIPDIREALVGYSSVLDKDSQRDAERLGRLMLIARYNVLQNPAYASTGKKITNAKQAQVFLRRDDDVSKSELTEAMQDYLRNSRKLLSMVGL
eukprot:gb/GFBE01034269.1/.p1 GENE.gb/GFBE01034269.1/~~gb/GFBE01034269.1/.p1  ORF type:complete len:247 (+),score=52.54 gb/GFBE01034269.1/:1-741(+)